MSKTAELLRKLRIKNNLTQKDLATRLNVNQALLSSWERGTRNLTIENAIKLSHIYKIPYNIIIDSLVNDVALTLITSKTA